MRKIISYLRITFVAIWTLIMSIVANLGILLFFWNVKLGHLLITKLWAHVLLFVCGVRVKSSGQAHFKNKPPGIFIGNHQSNFDIPALFVASPVPIYFMYKKELSHIPIFGWYLRLCGMIAVDRKNKTEAKKSLRIAGEKIKEGRNLLTFPEGTRTPDGEIHLFKRGSFIMAQEHDLLLKPFSLSGAREVLPKGSFAIKPGTICIDFLPVETALEYKHLTPEAYAGVFQNKVKSAVESR